jgi:hypothetical protein
MWNPQRLTNLQASSCYVDSFLFPLFTFLQQKLLRRPKQLLRPFRQVILLANCLRTSWIWNREKGNDKTHLDNGKCVARTSLAFHQVCKEGRWTGAQWGHASIHLACFLLRKQLPAHRKQNPLSCIVAFYPQNRSPVIACFPTGPNRTSLSTDKKQTNSVVLSSQANYTDWATATCRRNLVPTFVDRGVSRGQRGGSPTVVNLSFLERSRYFSFK